MEDQNEIDQRQKPMRPVEEAVGNTLDERDRDQRNHGIKGPLAQALRRVAEIGEQGFDRIACGRLRATRRSFEPAPSHGPFRTLRPQPVNDCRDQCRNAEPFVDPIHLVQPAQPMLRPARADGEDHRDAHADDRQDTAILHRCVADREKAG